MTFEGLSHHLATTQSPKRLEKIECWLWIGARDSNGYPMAQLNGKVRSVHRYVYELVYGPIPDGVFITQTCSRPDCLNPTHLKAKNA